MLKKLKYKIIPENWQHANSYLIQAEKNYLIDPSIDFDSGIAQDLDSIYATHFHFDHISQVDIWRKNTEAKFIMPENDQELLNDEIANCSTMFGQPRSFSSPDSFYNDEQIIEVEKDLFFKFYLLPGHSPGCSAILISYLHANEMKPFVLISGDVLFANSIGRTDLKGGDPLQMQESLKRLITIMKDLPMDLPVLPGHGPIFTIKDALTNNPYVRYFL
ncbi:MAG: MBL fold metallo-hydrolase [Clostridiaceae bacterium]|nr:MBL fold metallo-hydrolase [Clostridiaceae bacterium]